MVSRQILCYTEPHLFQRQFVQVTKFSDEKEEVKSCFYRWPSQRILANLYIKGQVGSTCFESLPLTMLHLNVWFLT